MEYAQLSSTISGALRSTVMTGSTPGTVIQPSLRAECPPVLIPLAPAFLESSPAGLPLGPGAGPPTRQHPGRRTPFSAAAPSSSSGLGGGIGLAHPPWMVDVHLTSTQPGPRASPDAGRKTRSRSPLRPLRSDAPGHHQRRRGALGADALETVLAAAGRTDPQPTDARPITRPRAAPDATEVSRIAARAAGDLVAELGSALRTVMDLELARRLPRPPSTSEASTDPAKVWVQNDRTGCVHIVGVGQDSGLSARKWQSLRGWFFGQWGGFTIAGGASQAPTCDRCLQYCST